MIFFYEDAVISVEGGVLQFGACEDCPDTTEVCAEWNPYDGSNGYPTEYVTLTGSANDFQLTGNSTHGEITLVWNGEEWVLTVPVPTIGDTILIPFLREDDRCDPTAMGGGWEHPVAGNDVYLTLGACPDVCSPDHTLYHSDVRYEADPTGSLYCTELNGSLNQGSFENPYDTTPSILQWDDEVGEWWYTDGFGGGVCNRPTGRNDRCDPSGSYYKFYEEGSNLGFYASVELGGCS
jgi:hypothetical protein